MSDGPPNGRKYTLTKAGLALMIFPLGGCYALAAMGKLTGDVATITTVYFGAVAGLIGAFHGANAYATGKALESQGGGS